MKIICKDWILFHTPSMAILIRCYTNALVSRPNVITKTNRLKLRLSKDITGNRGLVKLSYPLNVPNIEIVGISMVPK